MIYGMRISNKKNEHTMQIGFFIGIIKTNLHK